ncbi:MAG: AI-2E family transporter [Anaerolineales bacterium]|nr:AI-2E family transporter [Anaerolineales bacterium]MCB8940076.1 AI-2E family transporter [Ardenticatenaceae bacterium]
MSNRWSDPTRYTILIVLLFLMAAFLFVIRSLIGPLIIAALLAYILYPLAKRLESRMGGRYTLSVSLVYFPFLIILVATPSIVIPALIRQFQTLSGELFQVITQIEVLLARSVTILGFTFSPEELAQLLNLTTESFTPAAEEMIQAFEATSTSLLWLLVVLVAIYYLMLDWQRLRNWLIGLMPDSEQADLNRLLEEIDRTWRAYIRGTLLLMFMMGVFFTIVGLALGLPGAVGLGLLTGLLSIIPELGPSIAGIIAALVALFEGSNYLPLSNFWFAVLIASIYLVVMQVKALWLRPLVMGRFLHMNTGLVFVAIIGAALISGILAALIILPVLITAGQIGHYLRSKLLYLDPWPVEEEALVEAPSSSDS